MRADNLLDTSSAVFRGFGPKLLRIPGQNPLILYNAVNVSHFHTKFCFHITILLGNKAKIIVTPKKSEVLLCYIEVDKKIKLNAFCTKDVAAKDGSATKLVWRKSSFESPVT